MKVPIKITLGIFIVMALVQWSVPIKMIYDNEITIIHGNAYKFKVKPIDPIDPLRGKYIILNYAIDQVKTKDTSYIKGQEVFLKVKTDANDFAQADSISKKPFTEGDYLKVKVTSYNPYENSLFFEIPQNRFYMEEHKAYEAERVYQQLTADTLHNVYAILKLYQGKATIENVMIDQTAISRFLEK